MAVMGNRGGSGETGSWGAQPGACRCDVGRGRRISQVPTNNAPSGSNAIDGQLQIHGEDAAMNPLDRLESALIPDELSDLKGVRESRLFHLPRQTFPIRKRVL